MWWTNLVQWFADLHPVVAALVATVFTWLVTAAGAGLVFFFKSLNRGLLDSMLGFTGGVMVAASCFGLLGPAIEMTGGEGFSQAMPAVIGFIIGAIFGFISGGDGSFSSDINFLLVYFIQALGYMAVGLIIAILVRSSALSIIIFLCSILLESIVRALIPDVIDQYFPMKIISNLTPFPTPEGMMVAEMKNAMVPEVMSLNTTLTVAVIYVLAFWGIAYFILTKKDIK